jgi:S-DNA-T family DNA segregation ATPase FtsK/SpoIIIE
MKKVLHHVDERSASENLGLLLWHVVRWTAGTTWAYRTELAPLVAVLVSGAVLDVALPLWLVVVPALAGGGYLTRWAWFGDGRRTAIARRNLARIRAEFGEVCYQLGLVGRHKAAEGMTEVIPSIIAADVVDGGGVRLQIQCPLGVTPEHFEKHALELAGALKGSACEIQRDNRNAARCILTLVGQTDPLYGAPREPKELKAAKGGHDPTDGVPIGYDSSGRTVRIKLFQRSLLIGGSPSSGKSILLQAIVSWCALARDCELWCIDPKLVELATFWDESAHRMATDVESATVLLDDLIAVMNERYKVLQAEKRQKVTIGKETPMIVLVVDELAELTASLDKKKGAEFSERLRLLVSKGRAAGIVPILATQKPSSETCSTGTRDLISTRIALRCGTQAQAITILGDEAVKERGANAQLIGTDTPGLAYLTGEEGGEAKRFRAFFLDEEDMTVIPARAAAYRSGVEPVGSVVGQVMALDEKRQAAAEMTEATVREIEALRKLRHGFEAAAKDEPLEQPLPPREGEEPARELLYDLLDHLTAPRVVFGCEEHHGLEGAEALQEAHQCRACLLLPGVPDEQ